MTFKVKKTSNYFNSGHKELSFIIKKITTLNELNDRFLQYLPVSTQAFCQLANIENDHLVVMVSKAPVAMELRFMTDDLLRKINQDTLFSQIKTIHYKTRPTENPRVATQPSRNIERLSRETSDIVKDIAEGITDPTLRKILQRIAEYRK